jgi:lipopolysaccharide export system protein LptA
MTMEAERLTVEFEGTNAVKTITASGRVRMRQADRNATCDRAVYLASSGELTLQGDVLVRRGGDTLASEEVVLWVADERMQSRKPVRLVIEQVGAPAGRRKP